MHNNIAIHTNKTIYIYININNKLNNNLICESHFSFSSSSTWIITTMYLEREKIKSNSKQNKNYRFVEDEIYFLLYKKLRKFIPFQKQKLKKWYLFDAFNWLDKIK